MKRSWLPLLSLLLLPVAVPAQQGTGHVAKLRGAAPLAESAEAPRMERVENDDVRRPRNYPMQPPTIPHEIDGYQVDLNHNRCMECHGRRAAIEVVDAPAVSVTHYMDRDGNFLAEVSPRRYFCNQCHVTQTLARPLVSNTFQDVDELLGR